MSRAPRRQHRAEALDVASFCSDGGVLEGERSLGTLPRLVEAVRCGDDGFAGAAAVRWRAAGDVQRRSGALRWVIALSIETDVVLECQRCLQPVTLPLRVQRHVVFVPGEDEAARLDEEIEDDVLALPARLDLFGLIEDELLLALPLVPRHLACPRVATGHEPAASGAGGGEGETAPQEADLAARQPDERAGANRHRPFADLARLVKRRATDEPGGSEGQPG